MRFAMLPFIFAMVVAMGTVDIYCALPTQAFPHHLELYEFTTVTAVAIKISRARTVALSAYVLSEHGLMAAALCKAAARGAHVHVVLDGVAQGNVAYINFVSAKALRRHGIQVDLTAFPLHAKAAIVDGTVYLSDRNWAGHEHTEMVFIDKDPQDKPIVLRAISGQSTSNDHFSMKKDDALRLEADLITASHSAVSVETEAYTTGTSVEQAMVQAVQAGRRVRFLVDEREYADSPQEQRSTARLRSFGIETRVGRVGEKLAIAGLFGWIGSANATPGVPQQIDWGMRLPSGTSAALLQQFNQNWSRARAI